MTFPYSAVAEDVLARMRRQRELQAQITAKGVAIDAPAIALAIADLLDEVEPLPFAEGRRYRVRLFAGEPVVRHRHYENVDTGAIVGLDLPEIVEGTFEPREIVGRYQGRAWGIPGRRSPGSVVLEIGGGQSALFAEVDLLSAEEVP